MFFIRTPMKKANFASKTCANCGKPMSWRKKWSKVWNEVKYCGERCRRNKRRRYRENECPGQEAQTEFAHPGSNRPRHSNGVGRQNNIRGHSRAIRSRARTGYQTDAAANEAVFFPFMESKDRRTQNQTLISSNIQGRSIPL